MFIDHLVFREVDPITALQYHFNHHGHYNSLAWSFGHTTDKLNQPKTFPRQSRYFLLDIYVKKKIPIQIQTERKSHRSNQT